MIKPSNTPVSSKKTRFFGSICLTFSQYSNLNFLTLSVPAWLLLTVFFYDLIPTFVKRYTWLFYPPNFLFSGQITHTILVKWHRVGHYFSQRSCGIIQMTVSRFPPGFRL